MFDLLNAQPIGSSKFHGGGEYIKRVFDRLVQEYSKIIRIIAFYDHDKFLDEWLIKLMEDYRIETVNVKSIYELPNVFSNNEIDLFYTGLPYEYRTEILPKGVYKVATFHGMRAVECPHDEYEYKYTDSMKVKMKEQVRTFLKNTKWGYAKNKEQGIANYKECIAAFDKIVCVSNHTKYSLLNYFPELSEDQVEVRYSPLKNSTSRSIRRSCRKQEDEKYILLLGGNRWIKNSYRGLRALDDLYSRGHLQNIKTVVVGNLSKTIKSELVNNEKYIFKGYLIVANPIYFAEYLNSTIMKVGALLNGGTYTNNAVLASGATRNYANGIAMNAFLQSPFLGVGIGGTRGYGVFSGLLATFGLLGIGAFVGYLNSIIGMTIRKKIALALLLFVYLSVAFSVWYVYMLAFIPLYLVFQDSDRLKNVNLIGEDNVKS